MLRDYQEQAVQAVLREFESVQSTMVAAATGVGKTRIAEEIAKRMRAQEKGAVIFLAHRREILDQTFKRFEAAGFSCEYELADRTASEMYPADILFTSVQTLISGRNGSRRFNKFSPHNYILVIGDEAHHIVAKSWYTVLDYFKANKDIKFLYLTATPKRADKRALRPLVDTVAFKYPIQKAVNEGWLVRPEQQLIDITGLDFSHISTVSGDFNQSQLADVMEEERTLYGVCDAVMRELNQRRSIMFCVRVRQAEMCCEILNRYRSGVASWACGKTKPIDRDRVIRDYREGVNQIFVNVDLVSEGADFPEAQMFIDNAPTKSLPRYTQRGGRFLRPLPGVVDYLTAPFDAVSSAAPNDPAAQRRAKIAASAKPCAIFMDFCGNAGKHKLINLFDLLGGDISPGTRVLAEAVARESGKPMPIDALVLEAEKREREQAARLEAMKRAKLTGRATYTIRKIPDPFDAFGLIRPADRTWYRGKILSAKQRELLMRQGLDPEKLSYAEGKAVLDQLFYRWNRGLATLRQCACLKPYGYDTKGMTKEAASELINQLEANGWRKL